MARYFDNYVSLHGGAESSQTKKAIALLCEKPVPGEVGSTMFDSQKTGKDLVVFRLNRFETTHWESLSDYLSELSAKYPNVLIEWGYCGDDGGLAGTLYLKGHAYRVQMEAKRFGELAPS
jgi:hypothetical protein